MYMIVFPKLIPPVYPSHVLVVVYDAVRALNIDNAPSTLFLGIDVVRSGL